MSAQPTGGPMSLADYLTFEELSEARHELLRGQVRLMSGGTERHDLLVNAINVQLVQGLRGGPCRVFPHNRKLLTADGNIYYPDILVNCASAADRRYENDAVLVIEVLSPSNTRDELDDKLEHYLGLPSIRVYMTVDPESGAVTIYERHDLGWRSRMATRRADVKVEGFALDLAQAFMDVEGQVTT
ncbi:MAG: Uma2 family endonuclease [Actinobacteria bacterium]|nr:Uma2 family endonuclease [Actinomycetota bacterium]